MAFETLPRYAKVFSLGDPLLADLLKGSVVVEEKLDGSQFRFGRRADGAVVCGSHRVDYSDAQPVDAGFAEAVAYVEGIAHLLPVGWVFFAEMLAKPKQVTLAYARRPTNGLMLFDAYATDSAAWMLPGWISVLAANLGIDQPRVLFEGDGAEVTRAKLDEWLATVSYLGGPLIEGVVVKNYGQPNPDRFHQGAGFGIGKFVSPAFKEESRLNWKRSSDIVTQVIERYRTNARWEKAVAHLRDDGKIEGSMRDMRGLIDEIGRDLEGEARPEIERMLYEHHRSAIERGIKRGMAEWYKERLLAQQFAEKVP